MTTCFWAAVPVIAAIGACAQKPPADRVRVSGQVEAVNQELGGSPEKVNEDAYAAWMFRLRPRDPAQFESLLSAADYEKLVAAEEH